MEQDEDPWAEPSQPAQSSVPAQSLVQESMQAAAIPMQQQQQPQRAPWRLAAGAVVRAIGQAI
eukprot:9861854-Alexandrium_andersonii.AAC.1